MAKGKMSQIGSFPSVGVKLQNIENHHLVDGGSAIVSARAGLSRSQGYQVLGNTELRP